MLINYVTFLFLGGAYTMPVFLNFLFCLWCLKIKQFFIWVLFRGLKRYNYSILKEKKKQQIEKSQANKYILCIQMSWVSLSFFPTIISWHTYCIRSVFYSKLLNLYNKLYPPPDIRSFKAYQQAYSIVCVFVSPQGGSVISTPLLLSQHNLSHCSTAEYIKNSTDLYFWHRGSRHTLHTHYLFCQQVYFLIRGLSTCCHLWQSLNLIQNAPQLKCIYYVFIFYEAWLVGGCLDSLGQDMEANATQYITGDLLFSQWLPFLPFLPC